MPATDPIGVGSEVPHGGVGKVAPGGTVKVEKYTESEVKLPGPSASGGALQAAAKYVSGRSAWLFLSQGPPDPCRRYYCPR